MGKGTGKGTGKGMGKGEGKAKGKGLCTEPGELYRLNDRPLTTPYRAHKFSFGQRMPVESVRSPSPYFVNAAFDTAFVGGLSIATFLLLRQFGPPGYSEGARGVFYVLVWFI